MAASVASLTVTKQWADQAYHVIGTITVTAGDYVAGGIALNLNQADVKASRTLLWASIRGIAGYDYEYIKGADNSLGKLMIRAQTNAAAAGDPLGDLPVAAMPAAVIADTITFMGLWKGML